MKKVTLLFALAFVFTLFACDKENDLPDEPDVTDPNPTEYLQPHFGRYDVDLVIVDGVDKTQWYIDHQAFIQITDTLFTEVQGAVNRYKYSFDSLTNILYRIDDQQDTLTNLLILDWSETVFHFKIDQASPEVERKYIKI